MQGVERYKVKLLPHCEEWNSEYKNVEKHIKHILGDNVLEIQHIGSTSIKGIYAKPILDVAVKVKTFSDLNIQGMKVAGYCDCGESGVGGRYLFVLRKYGYISLQHIHCYEQDNNDFQNLVHFRDYLNQHSDYAKKYCDLKQKLAEKYPNDRNAYTNGKERFIKEVYKLVQEELHSRVR